MKNIKSNLFELLLCLSKAQDLISPNLSGHQQQVAYLSYRLAQQMELPLDKQNDVFLAALVHDIGILSSKERMEVLEAEEVGADSHAYRGAKLFEGFRPLKRISNIIKYHHLPWEKGKGCEYMGEKVPLESHIIHLADRVCTKIKSGINILSQAVEIIPSIEKNKGIIYEPKTVEALKSLTDKEYIWLDLSLIFPVENLPDMTSPIMLDIDDITELAMIFSHIIDFRNSFTAVHSAGVAHTAYSLAKLLGFSETECKMMLIAGYLHDLGKLAIDEAILQKPGTLTKDEMNVIRSHTYYTYKLLSIISQFDTINQWASYHHEKLNGKGYPFHITGDNLSLGSRIMAVADIFTAITEDRPYRKGMERERVTEVLKSMVENGSIDGNVVDVLIKNYEKVNKATKKSQIKASKEYKEFLVADKKT